MVFIDKFDQGIHVNFAKFFLIDLRWNGPEEKIEGRGVNFFGIVFVLKRARLRRD